MIVDYHYNLTQEKIALQKKYIADVEQNREKIIREKTILIGCNEEEIFSRKVEKIQRF